MIYGQSSKDSYINNTDNNNDIAFSSNGSQNFILKFSPIAAVIKDFHISSEYEINRKYSCCIQYSYFNNTGYKQSAGLKLYYYKDEDSRSYFEFRFLYGNFSPLFYYFNPEDDGHITYDDRGTTGLNIKFSTTGGSLLIGKQIQFSKYFFYDMNIGIQYFPIKISKEYELATPDFDNGYNALHQLEWYLIGPGSIITCNICFGIKF